MPNQKLALFTATKNLDVNYHYINSAEGEAASIYLEGNDLHQNLSKACQYALDLRLPASEQTIKTLKSINFATMGLHILYTDSDLDEGDLGDEVQSFFLPLFGENRVVSTMDFYTNYYKQPGVVNNKASRCQDFNQRLKQRVHNFAQIAPNYDCKDAVTSLKDLDTVISSTQFHETYHHTEQGGMHHITSPTYISRLRKELQKHDAAVFYGAVFDCHTQRVMCCNCNACLLGMTQSHAHGFLADVSKTLEKNNISCNPYAGVAFSVRVSAEKSGSDKNMEAFKLPNDANYHHTIFPQLEHDILQKHVAAKKPTEAEKQSLLFAGSLFSSKQAYAPKWERNINEAVSLKKFSW